MNPLFITGCVFVAATLLVVGGASILFETFFRYRSLVNARVSEETPRAGGTSSEPSLFKDVGNLRFDLKGARRGALERIRQWLVASATGLQLGHLLAASVMTGCGAGLVALLCQLPAWGLLATCLGTSLIPAGYVEAARRRRTEKLRAQLSEAFDIISRAVRAGRTLPATIQSVAEEMTPPLSQEFSHCFDQQRMGIALGETLRQLAERTGVTELKIFAVGLAVQTQSGGNVVELVDNLSVTVRKRQQQQSKMKAITAESRMQAIVLGTLPITAFIGLVVFAPDYVGCLLDKPRLLAATLGSQAAGAAWIRSIVSVRY